MLTEMEWFEFWLYQDVYMVKKSGNVRIFEGRSGSQENIRKFRWIYWLPFNEKFCSKSHNMNKWESRNNDCIMDVVNSLQETFSSPSSTRSSRNITVEDFYVWILHMETQGKKFEASIDILLFYNMTNYLKSFISKS